MEFKQKNPPRIFNVGNHGEISISDCGDMFLESDEQVTFRTPSGGEYDVTKKSWGFYATPSLGCRLKKFNLRPVLIKNISQQHYILLVESKFESEFESYCNNEKFKVIAWLDDENHLDAIEKLNL